MDQLSLLCGLNQLKKILDDKVHDNYEFKDVDEPVEAGNNNNDDKSS
jgi:hypothetical protein